MGAEISRVLGEIRDELALANDIAFAQLIELQRVGVPKPALNSQEMSKAVAAAGYWLRRERGK